MGWDATMTGAATHHGLSESADSESSQALQSFDGRGGAFEAGRCSWSEEGAHSTDPASVLCGKVRWCQPGPWNYKAISPKGNGYTLEHNATFRSASIRPMSFTRACCPVRMQQPRCQIDGSRNLRAASPLPDLEASLIREDSGLSPEAAKGSA